MYYNNSITSLNDFNLSGKPREDYNVYYMNIEQQKKKDSKIINEIYSLSSMERVISAMLMLYFDYNATNIDDMNTVTDPLQCPLQCFISKQSILQDFYVLFDVDLTIDDIKKTLVFLTKLKLLPDQNWELLNNTNKEYHILFPGHIYNHFLYNGILRKPFMLQNDCFYLPPFYMLIVEMLYFFTKERKVPVETIANFLHIPVIFCDYWLERLKVWEGRYLSNPNQIQNGNFGDNLFLPNNSNDNSLILSEEETMKWFTWYYNEACNFVKLNGFDSLPMKDFVNLQNSYFDAKKKYMEMLAKRDPNALAKEAMEKSGESNESLLMEAISVLQARSGIDNAIIEKKITLNKDRNKDKYKDNSTSSYNNNDNVILDGNGNIIG